jgi:hypothetical protein
MTLRYIVTTQFGTSRTHIYNYISVIVAANIQYKAIWEEWKRPNSIIHCNINHRAYNTEWRY